MSANTVDPKSFNDSDNIDRRRRKFNFAEFIKKFLKEVRAIDLSDLPQGQKTAKLLDEALEIIAHTDAFHDVLVRWLPDNLQPILEKRLKDRNESAAH